MATKRIKPNRNPDGFFAFWNDGEFLTIQMEAWQVKSIDIIGGYAKAGINFERLAPHQIVPTDKDLCPIDRPETNRTPQKRRKGRK